LSSTEKVLAVLGFYLYKKSIWNVWNKKCMEYKMEVSKIQENNYKGTSSRSEPRGLQNVFIL
jgi:hypothetical protein